MCTNTEYPHFAVTKSTITEFMDLQKWCANNCQGQWHTKTLDAVDIWGKVIRYRWCFKNSEDFLLFALTYGLQINYELDTYYTVMLVVYLVFTKLFDINTENQTRSRYYTWRISSIIVHHHGWWTNIFHCYFVTKQI